MTYPLKFRQKVVETHEREGLGIAQVAARFCVGVTSVVRLAQIARRLEAVLYLRFECA